MHPQLALRLLRELRDLLHLQARRQLIRRRTRLVQRQPPQRSLQHLHQRLLLRLPLHDPALRRHHPRRVPVCHCGQLQHREARLRERALRQQRLGLHGLPAHRQHYSVTRVPARLLQAPGKRVLVRRKACVRLAPRRPIVRAARRRVVLVGRPGSARVDLLRGSRSAPAVAADRVVATIKARSAHSAPAREFPRQNQASRSMRASRQHAVGR